jgi:hypothetical protein
MLSRHSTIVFCISACSEKEKANKLGHLTPAPRHDDGPVLVTSDFSPKV